ncbi:FAD-binding protein [Rhodococcus sp. H36-A4]|uniref:FAD-binding protein n=1 Tax=Rhodococcus sp. H36-A4 TaxID=3004353 RepID=UPI0022AFB889|nr:FAD-binding protein [Rhodococcus sp. H36-A4]MCZ4077572.1 FAD-binding protein [Rhodococcus sp. H36-A4]
MNPEDSWQQHAADTVKESYFLANPHTVHIVAEGAERGIADLVRYGMPFAREEDSRIRPHNLYALPHSRGCRHSRCRWSQCFRPEVGSTGCAGDTRSCARSHARPSRRSLRRSELSSARSIPPESSSSNPVVAGVRLPLAPLRVRPVRSDLSICRCTGNVGVGRRCRS